MKAFIVTAVVTNEWTRDMILTAINQGIQKYLRDVHPEVSQLLWDVTCKEEFDLKRQDR